MTTDPDPDALAILLRETTAERDAARAELESCREELDLCAAEITALRRERDAARADSVRFSASANAARRNAGNSDKAGIALSVKYHAVIAERDAALAEVTAIRAYLTKAADQYEHSGQPGLMGYNCWGWRDIAREIRIAAGLKTEEA